MRANPDSGGAGKHRGGLGCKTVLRGPADLTMNASIDRAHCLPWGLMGGLEATGNEVLLRRNGTWEKERINAKVLTAQLKAGEAYAVRSGGGGGFGSPLLRAPECVAEDVRQGYVSLSAARDYYGVVLDFGHARHRCGGDRSRARGARPRASRAGREPEDAGAPAEYGGSFGQAARTFAGAVPAILLLRHGIVSVPRGRANPILTVGANGSGSGGGPG